MRALLLGGLVLGLVLVACCRSAGEPSLADPSQLVLVERLQPAMGTQFRVRCYAADEERGLLAVDAAFARLAELEDRLSDYDVASELSQLSQRSRSGPTEPVPETESALKIDPGTRSNIAERGFRQGFG